jgi:hypothetical protein
MAGPCEAQASAPYRSALTELVGRELTLIETVLEISAIPYGRPRDRTPSGVLEEWRGTCSTKHMLLAAIVDEAWPECRSQLWHRVYRVTREFATRRWGGSVAATIPRQGLVDVHTFATLDLEHSGTQVDITFTLADWDGRSDIPLACAIGDDHPAGAEPLAKKAALERAHCDYEAREQFIAALSTITENR